MKKYELSSLTPGPLLAGEKEMVILAVDDRKANLLALERTLAGVPARLVKATSGEEALAASLKHRFALAILDVQMPGMDGYELADLLLSDPATARTPIIFVTAAFSDEQHLFKGYSAGAVDYIVKPYDPAILVSKVKVFLELARHRLDLEGLVATRTRALQASEERYRNLFETMTQGVVYQEASGQIIEANPAAVVLLGVPREQLLARGSDYQGWHAIGEDGSECPAHLYPAMLALEHGRPVHNVVLGVHRPSDGRRAWLDITAIPEFRTGETRPFQVYTTFSDITARRQAEQAVEDSERAMRAVFQSTQAGILVVDARTLEVQLANDWLCRQLACPECDWVGRTLEEIVPGKLLASILEHGSGSDAAVHQFVDGTLRRHDGSDIDVEVGLAPMELRGRPCLLCVFRDMTERRRAEMEQQRLQAELFQAQKMESIGALAGGVAHDFNNLLSVILGNVSLVLRELAADDPNRDDLVEVKRAGERSAVLTRQLLAFGRRQMMQRVPLDLNYVATGVEKLLRRIIGEDVDLTMQLAPDVGVVFADPGQVEQVIMNLAANARDAMPDGGRLTVTTENVEVPPGAVRASEDAPPGVYVRLSVTDTGCGMNESVRARIFEPFFTTKEKGKGTGLGLATVYGIVKQSEGHLEVSSTVGSGSTFQLYLKRLEGTLASQPMSPAEEELPPRGGQETILVVEDSEQVRNLAARTLRSVGYDVIVAPDGRAALRQCETLPGPIHLVVSDVVMPVMGGEELAERLAIIRPTTKILFMSGYTGTSFRRQPLLDPQTNFLEKPFVMDDLLRKVRHLLDLGSPSGTGANERADDAARGARAEEEAVELHSAIPPDEWEELRKAATSARYDDLVGIVDRLGTAWPRVAQELRSLIDGFEYDRLLQLLSTTGPREGVLARMNGGIHG